MAVAAHFWVNWQHSKNNLKEIQERYDLLEQQSRTLSQAFSIVNNPDVHPIELKANVTSDKESQVMVYWNEASGKVYINTMSLPANDKNHQYQLWTMVKGTPKSLGVFDASPSPYPQMLRLENIADISTFILTLEQEGDSSLADIKSLYYTSESSE